MEFGGGLAYWTGWDDKLHDAGPGTTFGVTLVDADGQPVGRATSSSAPSSRTDRRSACGRRSGARLSSRPDDRPAPRRNAREVGPLGAAGQALDRRLALESDVGRDARGYRSRPGRWSARRRAARRARGDARRSVGQASRSFVGGHAAGSPQSLVVDHDGAADRSAPAGAPPGPGRPIRDRPRRRLRPPRRPSSDPRRCRRSARPPALRRRRSGHGRRAPASPWTSASTR